MTAMRTSTTTAALGITGLTAGYGRATVLRDVDLTVAPGQVVALLGPNGAGKTTLLRTAAGLVRPSAGAITLGGQDITRSRAHLRSQAGLCLVPEGRGIFPALTVRENLQLQCTTGNRKAGLARVLNAFPVLEGKLAQPAGRLSGGQQQMVALGRCFASSPAVVLLDEVSMGLAPLVVDQIFEALTLLAAEGTALLLVEQYVSRALALADTVYLLDRGQVSWTGTPAGITEDEIMRRYLAVDLPLDVH